MTPAPPWAWTRKARDSGSLRLGIAWSSIVSRVVRKRTRHRQRAAYRTGHAPHLPDYDASQLQDVGAAWTALPGKPGIMVASGTLSAESYDAAWRLGVALERIGKHSRILPFPAFKTVLTWAACTFRLSC